MVRLVASALQVDCSLLTMVVLLDICKLSKNIYLVSEGLPLYLIQKHFVNGRLIFFPG